ncbi:hypothetical protein O181_009088 [Austropuccinia psidii MF-1]|uniref:Reverse transcriptase domain-containing protein n=1 Tax=Austropuccinia psidii MF-1 TaxID=1389203 RepID=A0A9Q3GJ46_9BASI|nr:hypothetical protein [Austropuccinia psidii MF-1]
MDKIIKTLQEGHAQLSKASKETNKRLNIVFEEQHHNKRDMDCLNQDINKLFNVYHNLKPQAQGHVMDNQYHQEDIKPDSMLVNKARSQYKYYDEDNMSYSEKQALKQLPEAPSRPKVSVTGESDHMELIDYIDELFIDVLSIQDYWITARLNTEVKGDASIWYTEMKEIHGRRNLPRWKMDKAPYEWCLRQFKRLKAIDAQMNIEMRNNKLLTQMPGELEHAVKCRCNQNCTPDDIENTLQDKKYSFPNYGPTDHYANNCPKGKKEVYVIEKVPEEESPTEDCESDSMGDAIIEQSDEEQDPREEFLVECKEETPLKIQEMQLEEGMPQDTANKSLCKHTQDSQTFPVTPTKGMAYIHGTATKMTVFIYISQQPLIIDSGAHCSIEARNYLDNHFSNWEKQLLQTKEKNFKSASGKMTSIGTIIKEIVIPHRKGNMRLNPEFVVLDDAHIQEFLLGTDYQRVYDIDIYNSKNRKMNIGINKEKKFSLDIYQISAQDPLEELLNEFREGHSRITLTSKQKLGLLKMLSKNRPAFAIGEEPLGKNRGHDIEIYLDLKRPYPPVLRRPPYAASLDTRKDIEKYINELLDMDFIRKIGYNEMVEITSPVWITWNDGKSRLCGDFRAVNNYTKADRYPIPSILHALDKLEKAKYITKMDCMKGFHQNGVKPNSIKLLRIICHMGIYEYTRMPFGIKNAPAHFQRMMDTILQERILEGWMVVYIYYTIIYAETWEEHVQS